MTLREVQAMVLLYRQCTDPAVRERVAALVPDITDWDAPAAGASWRDDVLRGRMPWWRVANIWRPIDTAPRSEAACPPRYVLVRCPCRDVPGAHMVMKAYFRDAWRDVRGVPLSYAGWTPEEWTEVPE